MDKDLETRKAEAIVDLACKVAEVSKALERLAFVITEEPENGKPEEPVAAKALTLEDVRAVLAAKSRDGFTAEVKALLGRHGAGKLSEVKPEEYAALMAEAEALGNA